MPETLAPPVSTAPVAAPITTADTTVHGFESSAFGKLDQMVDKPKETKAEPAKEPAKAKEPPKKEAAKEPEKTEPTKPEAKTEPEKPAETKPEGKTVEEPKKPTAWQFAREQEKKAKELQAEVERLKATSTQAKPEDHPEFKRLSEELEAKSKRLQELEEEVKYVNYERSTEYAEQYDKPYKQAVTDAISSISEFEVTNPDGTVRAATDADFWRIAQAKNAKDASAIAEELFGNPTAAAMALMERKRVIDAYNKAERAKQEFRTKGSEREKQMLEQRTKQAKEARAQWEKLNQEAEKKYPDLFAPKEGDTKWNELREKGFERVKAAFEGKSNPQLDSMVYMKAGAFDAVKYERDNLRAALKDAEAKIAEYEGSEPGTGSPAKETQPVKELTAFDKIERLAR